MIAQRLRILIYTHALAGGGAERVLATLASEFARRGHDVLFCVDRGEDENRAQLHPGIELRRIPGRNIGVVFRLAALIRRERPDVTLSGIGGPNLKHVLAALLAGRARRAVQTVHGFLEDEPGLLNTLGNRLLGLTGRLAGPVVCVSEALRLAVIARTGAPPARVLRIYNPIAVGEAPAQPQPGGGAPLVLFAGRLVEPKDPMLALRAFARLKMPEARLCMLGEGPMRPALLAEAGRLGVAGQVDLPGYVREPWRYFAAARVLLLTSRRETFGNVVVEALRFGLPVVATTCGGPQEILDAPGLGRLVPVGDEDAVVAALLSALAEEPDEALRARRQARAAQFSPETAADAFEALFRALPG